MNVCGLSRLIAFDASVLSLFIGWQCSIYRVVFIFTLGFCVLSVYTRKPCSEGEARAMQRHASAATAALNIAPSAEHNNLGCLCQYLRNEGLEETVNEIPSELGATKVVK